MPTFSLPRHQGVIIGEQCPLDDESLVTIHAGLQVGLTRDQSEFFRYIVVGSPMDFQVFFLLLSRVIHLIGYAGVSLKLLSSDPIEHLLLRNA